MIVDQKILAKTVGITETTLRRWRRHPGWRMPFYKDPNNNRILFNEDDVMKFLREKKRFFIKDFEQAFERLKRK